LAKESLGYNIDFCIKGFLDKREDILAAFENYPQVLGSETEYMMQDNDCFVVAIADLIVRKNVVKVLLAKKADFLTLIHNSAVLTQGVVLGEGCIIGRDVIISNDCKIGSHCTFNSKAMVGHDSRIGDYCNINAGVFIGGECIVEDEVTVHTYGIITPRLTIKEGAVVGVGSVVVKSCHSHATYFGNPAKLIFSKNKSFEKE
jgi:sugar O-acyltransferase (sialic acid O-acetyltransferase NeuD family)